MNAIASFSVVIIFGIIVWHLFVDEKINRIIIRTSNIIFIIEDILLFFINGSLLSFFMPILFVCVLLFDLDKILVDSLRLRYFLGGHRWPICFLFDIPCMLILYLSRILTIQ